MAKGGKGGNAGRKKGLSNKIVLITRSTIKKYPTFNPIIELLGMYFVVMIEIKSTTLKYLLKKMYLILKLSR